ncbi:MAG: AraC family transcriptional regulator [Bacillota bacterium]|nr:AraC family transcriptional regulator [Bacillota bacterium]
MLEFNIPFASRAGFNSELVYYYSGSETCRPGHAWGPGIRDHYLIHYILKGMGVLELDGHTFHLEKGDLFLIPPGIVARYEADLYDPWSYVWVGFNGFNAEKFLKKAGLNQEHPIMKYGNDVETCIRLLADGDRKSSSRSLRAVSLLYECISLLIDNNCLTAPQVGSSSKEEYFKRAIEYINMNYSHQISVEGIAHHIGIDRKYLHSIFKEFANLSPQEYIISFRIERACELMKEGKLKINYIAHSVGYYDAFLFSKMFKKEKGISPAYYIKNINGVKNEKN